MGGGGHARNPVAVGMTGDHGRARVLAGDDMRDVAGEILHPDAFERARAAAGASRLRTEDAIAGCASRDARSSKSSEWRPRDGSMANSGPRPSAVGSVSKFSIPPNS